MKPGPTGLITTSIKPLGAQANTWTLTVPISDSPEQTRLVMHAQADRANDELVQPDFESWVATQRWLAVGLALPNTCPLPKVAELVARVCVQRTQNDSNTRTHGPMTQLPLFEYT